MATKKPKTTAKAKTAKAKTSAQEPKAVKTAEKVVTEAPKTQKVEKKNNPLKGFFAKKYEGNESILVIFKNPKLYGALIAEILGTMMIGMLLFSMAIMNIANIAIYAVVIIAILVAFYRLSGSNLNPIVTAGMMATRRMSVVRGVLYIIAQVIGAWLAWLIFNAYHLAGGDEAYAVPVIAEIAEGKWWVVASIEIIGAGLIGFFFARALAYRRSVFTFAAVAAGGLSLAILIGYIVSVAFVGLSSNFIMNPAVALLSQIFPTVGENFGEILGGILAALGTYVILPAISGVVGFYLSDLASRLAGEEQAWRDLAS